MSRRKDKPLKWDAAVECVLALTFEGRHTVQQIAEMVAAEMVASGSHTFTLSTRAVMDWRSHPDFQRRLGELRADFAESVRDVLYVEKAQRLRGLSQVAESARRAYEAQPTITYRWQARSGVMNSKEAFNYDAFTAFREALADMAAELGDRSVKVAAQTQQIKLVAVNTYVIETPEG